MSELQILSVDEARSADVAWPDMYFTPEYGAAAEASEGSGWFVAVWSRGPIVFPFLKRPVPSELGTPGLFDVVSPYGYCGTWAPDDVDLAQWQQFRTELRAALREQGA